MRVIYLFIDGVGLGENDPDRNPFSRYALSYLSAPGDISPSESTAEGWEIAETDAHLGFDGLPQSATGQTSLWTGTNGVRAMQRHKTGFPGPTLIRVIREYSVIKAFHDAGRPATLLNAYSDDYVQRIQQKPRLKSASTHLHTASGQALKRLTDLERGDALYMDITHEIMHRLYPDEAGRFPLIDARQRGRDLVAMARRYELCVFEFFLSDKAGHDQAFDLAEWVVRTLEEFIAGIVETIDPEEELLLITSDHGNLEDLSTKSHTNNKVPTFAFGKYAAEVPGRIRRLTDIVPFIYEKAGLDVSLPGDDENPDPQREYE